MLASILHSHAGVAARLVLNTLALTPASRSSPTPATLPTMPDQMTFDERTAAQLEVVYRTRDIRRRRALAEEALAAQPGDEVLDVGCGPGFYVADILETVGEHGAVTGVDASAAMLAIAARKAGDRPNVRLLEGEATKLPVGDASVDRAISVQVFEYLSDVDAALAELMRVVRPGGRVVIWDIDWSTLSWHSSDPARMRRMVRAWDRHLADPVLPRTLRASLRRAGFTDVRRDAHPFTAETMDPEAFGGYMPALIRRYLGGLDDIDQSEADAWLADLQALDADGAYSFAVLQFCFTARR
jgi:ubiquinone/menaquinone biosynthesis C-methylase UbiE